MISQNFPFLQPPQPSAMMYPFPFDFYAPSPFSFALQNPMFQSQLYKRENPYAGYDVKLPANNSQKKLKTQFGASQIPTSRQVISGKKIINLEEEDDNEDLIIIDDDAQNDSNSLCVKDSVFEQMKARAVLKEESPKQESGYFKSLFPNRQFLLNPSGANFNSRSNGFLSQTQPSSEPLVISLDDDDEHCDSNMSFDSFGKSNLAVSICISNNDYVFSNFGPNTPKKAESKDAKLQLNPNTVEKGGFRNQIKIKNINISYFQPCSQFDKDASTTIPESLNTASESLSLTDNQGAINFEDSETQSQFVPNDESPEAAIPAFRLNKADKKRTRRGPKLVWDPKDLDRTALEQYYSDLTKVTRKEITNEEVAINSLKMNGMDIPKTLELVKHNRAIFRDLFTVKPHLNTTKK